MVKNLNVKFLTVTKFNALLTRTNPQCGGAKAHNCLGTGKHNHMVMKTIRGIVVKLDNFLSSLKHMQQLCLELFCDLLMFFLIKY